MKRTTLSVLISLSAASLLVACGGSGSSSSTASSGTQVTSGVIDGFGSVIVNGIHFDSTNTSFDIDDATGTQHDLHVGQVVTIVGSYQGTEGVAASISYDVNAEGPVTAVDAAAGTLVVLGQTVTTDTMTMLEGFTLDTLTIGTRVEVSGYADGNGHILASYIGLDDSDTSDLELHGEISQLDSAAMTFMIGSQLVSYASLESTTTLTDGARVEIDGALDASNVFIASRIKQDEDRYEHDSDLALQGVVTELDTSAQTFTLNGVSVSYGERTEFEHGTVAQLALNLSLRVHGHLDANGVLQASEIKFAEQEDLEISGPVDSTDVEAGTLTIMGLTVHVDTTTRVRDERDDEFYFNLASLVAGDYVELRLTQKADGSYQALRMKRDDADTEVSIQAPLEALDLALSSVTVLGISVDVSAVDVALLSTLTVGATVEVKGTFDGSVLTVTQLEVDESEGDETH